MERVTGIEPAWPAWKAGALPLSYTRMFDAVCAGPRLPLPQYGYRIEANVIASVSDGENLV